MKRLFAIAARALIPWAEPAPPDPIALRISHNVVYDPAGKRIEVRESAWDLGRLNLLAFGGRAEIVGRGSGGQGRPSDAATPLTVERVDVRRVMEFLKLPRAGEIEALVSGR
ncbi:MAG: hypothetical protein M1457_09220, partial [bacterium]|nr:hypothetical protein [bacterium]